MANTDVGAMKPETTVGIVTALNPVLGYDRATELASEANKTIREKKILSEQQVRDLLGPGEVNGT